MKPSLPPVRELFELAREIPVSERPRWLEEHCPDRAIRSEVEELLSFDIDDHFMEQALIKPMPVSVTASYQNCGNESHRLIGGRYKLLQPIGEGGFGVVFMADQIEPLRRRVAIKRLRSNMDSKSVIARFESERQALAMMDHPNIARVFDGGVDSDGSPYFVMELVNGVPLTDFCDANQLSDHDRMQLLILVCNAVQHAHHKGMIHRDLKPSNILVSLMDGVPIPKVIDFGIAKALHGPLTDKTYFTAFQQMIGTPEYMSPEQAETSILDVDTRSDVFSLGVLAYELLTGTTPFDGKQLRRMAMAELQRTIREVEPPKPSQRVSTLGEQANMIASRHGSSQTSLQKTIQGDLDWIVMKAMEKDRNRRYSSAQALAEDIRRWIQEEPIEARPPSLIYRVSKFVKKHRGRVAALAILAIGILLAAIGLGYGLAERSASLERQQNVEQRNQELQRIAQIETDRSENLQYGNAMIAAYESFVTGRRTTTLELLENCPEGKRGIEWNWISHLAKDRTRVLMQGPSANALAFAPEAHRLYTAHLDGMLRLWNTDTCQEQQSWRVADEAIVSIEVSRNGRWLVWSTLAGHVTLWDVSQSKVIASAASNEKGTRVAIYDSESQGKTRLAFGCEDGSILVWRDSLANEPLRLTNAHLPIQGKLQTVEFSEDGSQLLAAGMGSVTLFSTETGETITDYGQNWQSYNALHANRGEKILVYGPPLVLLNVNERSEQDYIDVPSTVVRDGVYVSSNNSLVLATQDQCLRRIHLDNGLQETLGYVHSAGIRQLAVASDGHSLAVIDDAGAVRLLNSQDYACPRVVPLFASEVAKLAAGSSEMVYAISNQGELVGWDARSPREVQRTAAHSLQGFDIVFDTKLSRLYSNGLDLKLKIWSVDPLVQIGSYDLSLGARHLALHPDGSHLVGPMPKDLTQVAVEKLDLEQCRKSQLAYWNMETGRVERCFSGLTNWAMKLRFSSDGSHLAAATVSDGAIVWPMDSSEFIQFFEPGLPQVDDIEFSKDGKYLFVAYRNGQVLVWDINARKLQRKMVCHGDQISGLLVSADGSRMLTASVGDSRWRVWDWRSGQKMAEFHSGLSGINDMQFLDGTQRLLIGGKDGSLHVWNFK